MLDRRSLLVLAFAAALFASGIWAMPLQEPDEGRYADIAATMARGGDFLTPHLDGIRYYEKPPLFFWSAALAMRAFGPTEWAARLPSALAALATVATVLALGRAALGPRTGALAGLVLASAPLLAIFSRVCIVDVVLLAFLTGALAALHQSLVARAPEEAPRRGPVMAFYALAALATLTKGPIGAAIPAVTAAAYVAATRDWRGLGGVLRPDGPALYLAIAAPWFVAMSLVNHGYAQSFFIGETLERFATGGGFDRDAPPWYYLPVLAGTFAPWSFAAGGVLARAQRTGLRPADRRGRSRVFFLAALLGPLLLLSFAHSKLVYYALPLFPPLALLTADAIAREEDPAPPRPARGLAWAFAATAAIALVVAALFAAGSRLEEARLFELFYARDPHPDRIGARTVRVQALLEIFLPAAAALTGLALGAAAAAILARRRSAAAGAVALALALGAFAAVFPFIARKGEPTFSERPIALAARRVVEPDDVVCFFVAYYRTVPFYLGRPVVLFEAKHAEFGQTSFEPEDLRGHAIQWHLDALRNLLLGERRVVVIVEDDEHEAGLRSYFPDVPLYRIGEAGLRRLVANRPLGPAG
jgi:4-amino-4-deoxy-L-arabinose transferase-like glycosyltransferase